MLSRCVGPLGLFAAVSVSFLVPVPARAQSAAEPCANEAPATRQQCIDADKDKKMLDVKRESLTPAVPIVDIEARIREACGVKLSPTSGMPNAKDVIIVAADKRQPIDEALRSPGVSAADVAALNIGACFSRLGTTDYVLVAPSDRPDNYPVVGGDGSALSRWLESNASREGTARLPPKEACDTLLSDIGNQARAVWVEDEHGPSLCERDAGGGARVDPNKINGYSGAIVLQVGPR